ncbi:MAG: 30S ribosomal protein S9 [Candidatus Omnitrophica bacterium]|nr:30S ribosomal protein S9 [Candidatus Omnitrophota bacterium]
MADSVFYATGRRKAARARVWIFHGQKGMTINGKDSLEYLKRQDLKDLVVQPLKISQMEEQFRVRVDALGGGVAGQAGAIRLGIARALLKFDEKLRPMMRKAGYLTRDPREKERKKFSHKGARKSFQYTKR